MCTYTHERAKETTSLCVGNGKCIAMCNRGRMEGEGRGGGGVGSVML